MKAYILRFNLFFAVMVLLGALCGCASWFKHDQPMAALRVHIELAPTAMAGPDAQTVSVLRADPVQVTVDKNALLTEANVVAVKLISTPVAPAIEIRFDENGTWILEQYSATNPGRHFVIFGRWGEKLKEGRWLAAPLITKRINDGILSFTPDMSRDEANQFDLGLSNVVKQFQTGPHE